ncbi:hypothetical protein Tco_0894369 [Tanacetum coccineum]|uniref:Uncharacterized protein n=1 Tax=Tanacetum coccineum TaxID=301880 RepID=A0ABQ5CE17_9ASTR
MQNTSRVDYKSALSVIKDSTVQGSRGSIIGYKFEMNKRGIVSDEEMISRNWKHIIVLWQRLRKSYLQNQVLRIRHWNRTNLDEISRALGELLVVG